MNTTKSEVFIKFFGWWGDPIPLSHPPVGKTLIQVCTLIIVNDCVWMYDNVYCVAVENFNNGFSGSKIDLFHQGEPSIMLLQKKSQIYC